MTGREAVLSLMAKDKHNPTIKALKQAGLLQEILYPDGPGAPPWRDGDDTAGREGGRSLRSIAKEKKPQKKDSGWSDWGDGPALSDSATAEEGQEAVEGGFEDGFSPRAWNAQLSRAGLGGGDEGDGSPRKKWEPKSMPAAVGGGDEWDGSPPRKWEPKPRLAAAAGATGFDDAIDDLMADFSSAQGDGDGDDDDDDPEMAAIDGRGGRAAGGKGDGLITTKEGRRGWWPKGQEPRASAPKVDRRGRDSAGSGYGSSYGNDGWLDGSTSGYGYDAYSGTGSGRSSDRADSERVLDDLLKDLDIGGGGASIAGGSDLFDFSDDERPPRAGGDGRGFSQRSTGGGSGQRGPRISADVPKMEDFATFQQYLDALVNHDKAADTAAPGKRWQPGNGRGAGRDADTLDDDIVDLLGGGDGDGDGYGDRYGGGDRDSRGSGRPPPRSAPRNDEAPRRARPATTAAAAAPTAEGDLDAFMDALEASSVVSGPHAKGASGVAQAPAPAPQKPQKPAPSVAPAAAPSGGPVTDYGKLTVPALKALLKEKGKPVGGTKPELISRLQGI